MRPIIVLKITILNKSDKCYSSCCLSYLAEASKSILIKMRVSPVGVIKDSI